MIKTL